MYRLIVVLVLLTASSHLSGQWDIRKFKQYSVEDGLPSMVIYDVHQDSSGYVWIATNTGLCRYDGYQFERFTTQDGLSNNDIVEIDYVNNILWLSSLGPLTCYKDGKFIQTSIHFEHSSRLVAYKIASTPNDNYWISTYSNLYKCDSNFNLIPIPESITQDYKNFTVFNGPNHETWLFRSKKNKYNFVVIKEDSILHEIPLALNCHYMHSFSPLFYKDYLYFQCGQQMFKLHLESKTISAVIDVFGPSSDNEIINDQLWNVSPNNGLAIFDILPNGDLRLDLRLFKDEYPGTAYQDREGNIWMGSIGSGLFFLPAQAKKVSILNTAGILKDPALETVLATEKGIWVGNRGGELALFSESGQILKTLSINKIKNIEAFTNRVVSLKEIAPDTLLMGADKGLFLIMGNEVITAIPESVKDIFLAPDGTITISTSISVWVSDTRKIIDEGIKALKSKSYTYKLPYNEKVNGRTYASLVDKQGRLWAGSSINGLMRYHEDEVIKYGDQFRPLNILTTAIAELDNDIIAVATHGEGLILIKQDQFFHINDSLRLASNFCTSLCFEDGVLWVGTDAGLSKIEHINFEKKSLSISNFRQSDGLISNNIQGLSVRDDEVYIATHFGLINFNQKELTKSKTSPDIRITGISVNEKERPLQGAYQLAHYENNISFRYVGLSFKDSPNLYYAYKLEGVDKDWKYSKILETRYSSLAPGTYRFSVRAINEHGLENEIDSPIIIVINPHFTQTKAFILGISILIALIISLGFYTWIASHNNRWLKEEVRKKTSELNEKIEDLANANLKLERSNEELRQFAHVASHDLKSPLRSITSFVQLLKRRVYVKLDDKELEYIDFAVQGAKNMEQLIDDLLNFSQVGDNNVNKEAVDVEDIIREVRETLKAEINTQNARLEILTPLPTIYINRLNAIRLFQNLISNAIKFNESEPPVIGISSHKVNKEWLFSIQDNGIGMQEEYQQKVFQIFQRLHTTDHFPGTGVGLAICKKIVEENKGRIWFKSVPGQGTTFFFTFPMKKKKLKKVKAIT